MARPRPVPGLPVSSRAPRSKIVPRSASGMPLPSSSTSISTALRRRLDGHEHAAAAIFGGIFDQIAEHFVQILALDPHRRLLVAGEIDGDVRIEPRDRPLDRLQRRPDRRAGMGGGAAADRAGAGEMVVDLAAHRRRLADHGRAEILRLGGGGLVMTVSGVFSAWARLPAWRRASSAWVSLWASRAFSSSVSGSISRGSLPRSATSGPSGLPRYFLYKFANI